MSTELEQVLNRIEKLAESIALTNQAVTGTLARHTEQLAQLSKEKQQLFILYNDKVGPKIDDIKQGIIMISSRLDNHNEKINENKESFTKGLSSIRRACSEQDKKIDKLERAHDEAEGRRKFVVRLQAAALVIIAILTLFVAMQADKPKPIVSKTYSGQKSND